VEAKDDTSGEALDDNADASTSSAPDAKARYQALKKRKLQEAEQQQQQQVKSPSTRKSPRKVQDSSLASAMARKQSQASQEGRTTNVTAASFSDDLSSNARRQRISSPGRSRGFMHGQLNSFYMDREGDTEEEINAGHEESVPSSILLGAQRQSRDFLHGGPTTDLDSIHSSDLHDSRVRDYTDLQREADLLANEGARREAVQLNGVYTPTREPRRNGVHAVDAAVADLNGIAEESDEEHSATEGRKHTHRLNVQEQFLTKEQSRSPPKVAPSKIPVPIRRHSAPRSYSSWLTSLALLGGLLALAYSIYRGLLLDPLVSAFPSDATIGDAALKKRIQLLESRLGVAEKRVDVYEGKIGSCRLADQIAESARAMPAELAALRADVKAGANLKLDDKTLAELKRTFVQKGEHVASTGIDAKAMEAIRKDSEAALRKLSAELFAQGRQDGNIVDHSALAEHVNKELNALKAALEARFNANTQEMQNDILAKVRQQQDMFERAGSWKKAGEGSRKAIDNIGDAHESLRALIDDALEVFAADRIGERDFALYTAGGRVVPSLTSPSYSIASQRPIKASFAPLKWLRRGPYRIVDRLGELAEQGQPPVIALVPDNLPGLCWAFAGSQGTLGITLARRVVVTKITLDHAHASISHGRGLSAPRDVIVWGMLERPADVKRLQAYRQGHNSEGQDVAPVPAPPSDKHVLLSSFTYDVSSSRAIQTFDVSQEAADLQIPVNVVQVQILSNHGEEDFTCLYRVRVHGREWRLEDEAATEV
jgi:hypothetical protein